MKARFKVYEDVWVMFGQKPKKLIVFAVVESMGYWKTDTEIRYHLVSSCLGAGWGNNSGEVFKQEYVHATKEELIASL